LKYDAEAQQFSITAFANSLEKDLITLLSSPLTRSVASSFDLNTNVPPSPSLPVRLVEKEGEVRNENDEGEEVEGGEGGCWTIVRKADER
jgi:hypothetical protein